MCECVLKVFSSDIWLTGCWWCRDCERRLGSGRPGVWRQIPSTVTFLASHPAQHTINGHTLTNITFTQMLSSILRLKISHFRLYFSSKVFKRLNVEGTESCVWAGLGDVNIYHYLLSATNTVYNLQTVLWASRALRPGATNSLMTKILRR